MVIGATPFQTNFNSAALFRHPRRKRLGGPVPRAQCRLTTRFHPSNSAALLCRWLHCINCLSSIPMKPSKQVGRRLWLGPYFLSRCTQQPPLTCFQISSRPRASLKRSTPSVLVGQDLGKSARMLGLSAFLNDLPLSPYNPGRISREEVVGAYAR